MSKWKPKIGEEYWYIGIEYISEVWSNTWYGDELEEKYFTVGNVFKTKEEAEFQLERLKVISELKSFSTKLQINKDNYGIEYDAIEKEIYIYNNIHMSTGGIVFDTKKDAENAIEAVGKDRVLKYYLGVEE